jgi:outer membrane protein assembly factor BamD
MSALYMDRAAEAYAKVITRYPMAAHVEDARDRLVAMNRPVPEPTPEAVAENDAEVRSQQPLHFTDKTLDIIKHGPMVVQAVHVGEPSLADPKRTLAPEIAKQNLAMFSDAVNQGKPPAAVVATPTGPNEPTRSDQPSTVPVQMGAPSGGSGVGAEIVSAPNGAAAAPDNSGLKSVGPVSTAMPAPEKPAEAPIPVNEVKSTGPTVTDNASNAKAKKPKVDSSEESDSKKKKKKGLAKLNPF